MQNNNFYIAFFEHIALFGKFEENKCKKEKNYG